MNKNLDKGRIYSVRTGITATKERRRQQGGVMTEIVNRDVDGKILIKRHKAVWECHLDEYYDRHTIGEPEHKAGIIFRRAYFQAVLCRRAAYERYKRNLTTIEATPSEKLLKSVYRTLPSYTMGVIIDICGHDRRARYIGELNTLKNGLERLAIVWDCPK